MLNLITWLGTIHQPESGVKAEVTPTAGRLPSRIIVEQARMLVIVDRASGPRRTPPRALELGCDAVPTHMAKDALLVAEAMRLAVEAERKAYLAGGAPAKLYWPGIVRQIVEAHGRPVRVEREPSTVATLCWQGTVPAVICSILGADRRSACPDPARFKTDSRRSANK